MARVEHDDTDDRYQHPDPVVDAALTWFVTLQDGTPDAETVAAYRAWRGSDPRHAAAYDLMAGIGGMAALRDATLASAAPVPAGRIEFRPAPRPMPRRLPWPSLAAAMLLVAVGLHLYPGVALWWQADYRTAAGERRQIVLPDGSRLVLNTASAVALDFAAGRRTVRLLAGEAYFDVAPDPDRPFRVAAEFSAVQVTGTAFGVRSDGAQDAIVLEHGRVAVSRPGDAERGVTLAPGDRVTATATGLSAVTQVQPATALAWRDGRYVFHEQPFTAVVANLRRYYGGVILAFGERIDHERVSGNYRLDDPVATLRALADIAGVPMTVLPGGVIILG